MPEKVYDIVSILGFLLLFAPFVISVFRLGIQDSTSFFLMFLRKNLIFYLLYIILLYVIKNNIMLGDSYIDFSMLHITFRLTESTFSDLVMAYAYIFFDSILAKLFFVFLPIYVLFFKNICRYK